LLLFARSRFLIQSFVSILNPDLSQETERLTRSWAKHQPAWLRNYLVSGVEDPCLNLQSILSRHFLIRALTQDRFGDLMHQEYRFAAVLDWLQRVAKLDRDFDGRAATLYSLQKGSDNAEGLEIPPFISQTFAGLPGNASGSMVPNYIETFLAQENCRDASMRDPALDTFCTIWNTTLRQHLATRETRDSQAPLPAADDSRGIRLSLLEPACGSANDYRFLDKFGVAKFFNYTGFDLCQTNIENARTLYPGTCFRQGNVFEISAPDKSFDLCLVHDLFEHLSFGGLNQAVEEICRVTRHGICVGFFQMDEIPDHVLRPLEDYHWNLLSLARIKESFAARGFVAQAVHIGTFLLRQVGSSHTHNPNAYTLFFTKRETQGGEAVWI
jgi:SAM-dependent methyltransferase